jgi:glutaredoxin 3
MQKVTVYSAPWCPYCVALEKKLKSMDVTFEYRNVDEAVMREEMNMKTDNNQTIPVLFVGEQYWVNPDAAVLQKLFGK